MAWQGIHGIGCCGGQQSEITDLENSETIKNVLFGANVIIVAGDGRVVDQIVSWSILILHHMFKANVYVVCGQVEHNEPYLKQLGACQVIDHRKDFVSQLTEKVGHRAMRLALDYDGEGGNKSECHQVLTLEDGHNVSYCSNTNTSSAVSYPSSICSILGLNTVVECEEPGNWYFHSVSHRSSIVLCAIIKVAYWLIRRSLNIRELPRSISTWAIDF